MSMHQQIIDRQLPARCHRRDAYGEVRRHHFTNRQTLDWVCEAGVGRGKFPAASSFSEAMALSLPLAPFFLSPRPGCS